MSKEKLSTLLELIIPDIIELIKKENRELKTEDINKFYSSRLYKELEDEETELWHYSPLVLYDMYKEELETGNITYPESAS